MNMPYRTAAEQPLGQRLRTRWVRIVLSRSWSWLPVLVTAGIVALAGVSVRACTKYKVEHPAPPPPPEPCGDKVYDWSHFVWVECEPPRLMVISDDRKLVHCTCPGATPDGGVP